jgi:hypothetical protein
VSSAHAGEADLHSLKAPGYHMAEARGFDDQAVRIEDVGGRRRARLLS